MVGYSYTKLPIAHQAYTYTLAYQLHMLNDKCSGVAKYTLMCLVGIESHCSFCPLWPTLLAHTFVWTSGTN